MTYEYAGVLYDLPDDLTAIPLATLQGWTADYGHGLALAGIKARQIADPDQQRLQLSLLFYEQVTAALSFFSTPDISVDYVRANIQIGQIVELLSLTNILLAIQGPHMFVPEQLLTVPASVEIAGETYELQSPAAGLVPETLTHEEFLCTLTLAGYMIELLESEWSHLNVLAAGYLRLPGEVLSASIIEPGGARAVLMGANLTAAEAAPLAQYFVRVVPDVLAIIDSYTNAQLSPPSS